MSLSVLLPYLLYISLPILVVYLGYLILTKAFNDMGFSSFEAIVIVFASFLFGFGLLNFGGIEFNNIPLFDYGNWRVGINTGGAIIPIILSMYLVIKNKISLKKLALGIVIVSIVTYFVTSPDPQKGIISRFPYWLLPVIFASVSSLVLFWREKQKAAPFAYICGTIGVLVGADVFHLITLLSMQISKPTRAIIGGAVVFDMVFITGILAVIVDGMFIYKKKYQQ
ncbi:MAG: DUF1614 domain-containing protein [Thermoplasmatota archaeon]